VLDPGVVGAGTASLVVWRGVEMDVGLAAFLEGVPLYKSSNSSEEQAHQSCLAKTKERRMGEFAYPHWPVLALDYFPPLPRLHSDFRSF
jgi:hypothetical protein